MGLFSQKWSKMAPTGAENAHNLWNSIFLQVFVNIKHFTEFQCHSWINFGDTAPSSYFLLTTLRKNPVTMVTQV